MERGIYMKKVLMLLLVVVVIIASTSMAFAATTWKATATQEINADQWGAAHMVDGDPNTLFSNVEGVPVWAVFEADKEVTVGSVEMTPRLADGNTYHFPVDFKFETSKDGKTWETIPGAEYTNYQAKGDVNKFEFKTPVTTKWIRIYITKNGKAPDNQSDDQTKLYFQMGEVKFNETTAPAAASTDSAATTATTTSAAPAADSSSNPKTADAGVMQFVLMALASTGAFAGYRKVSKK